MIVYGRNPVREALRGPREVREIWVTKNAARESWVAEARSGSRPYSKSQPEVTLSSATEIEGRCGSPAHQGICAEVSAFRYAISADLLAVPEPLIVALDEVM